MGLMPTREVVNCFGFNMTVFEDDYISQQIIQHGCFERFTLDAMQHILSLTQPCVSLDIGANLGNHAMIIASKSLHVFAFEPNPIVYELLNKNLENNNFSHTKALNIGLSSKRAEHRLCIKDPNNLGSASVSISPPTNNDTTTAIIDIKVEHGDECLQALLKDEGNDKVVDFIKIDVEGHELEVLQGLEQTIRKDQPLIFMEWNSQSVRQDFKDNRTFENLFSGYSCYGLSNNLDMNVYRAKRFGKLRRFVKRLTTPKHWSLIPFVFNNNYKNIVLIPHRYSGLISQINIIR